MAAGLRTSVITARDYDLAATLSCGQAFRWQQDGDGWQGVVGGNWVRLRQVSAGIEVVTTETPHERQSLADYLQAEVDLEQVLATFPQDAPMKSAVAACRGLRLLRQDPWECLASFILSSTKQIIQIQQIISLMCERHGDEVATPPGQRQAFAFPGPDRLASASETDLRDCKMGFRAPYLRATARAIADRQVDLAALGHLPVDRARAELMELPGVGRKIADCVLLFAYGFQSAFPIDVWVEQALQTLYFSQRRASRKQLHHFSETHFGPYAGYAQQYLFHYMRIVLGRRSSGRSLALAAANPPTRRDRPETAGHLPIASS